jgi:hypothetical protein
MSAPVEDHGSDRKEAAEDWLAHQSKSIFGGLI